MRNFIFAVFVLTLAAPLSAQRVNIDFPGLAAKARETVDVTLDGPLLKFAAKFLNPSDPDQREAREIVSKLEGIYVRSYEFDREGEYDRTIIDRLRAQLGPNWKRIVTVQSRDKDNVDIFVDMRADNIVHGLVVISAEPRELTLVNLVGPVDIDKLTSLEGEFGIPHWTRKGRRHDE